MDRPRDRASSLVAARYFAARPFAAHPAALEVHPSDALRPAQHAAAVAHAEVRLRGAAEAQAVVRPQPTRSVAVGQQFRAAFDVGLR